MTLTKHNQDILFPDLQKFGKPLDPKSDPTKTKTLRARWVRQMGKRWGLVSAAVPDILTAIQGLPPERQLEQFMVRLRGIEEQTILERRPMPWTNNFVQTAFARGVIRGNRDLRQLARQKPKKTTELNVLRIVVNQNFELAEISSDNVNANIAAGSRAQAFELEAQSTWQGLSGVTDQVNTQVAQVLTQSIQARLTLVETAAAIDDRIDKIGKTRSELIARTETVAANNVGAVSEYAAAEAIIGEPVLVQWQATLDSRVRASHLARHGKVFTQDQYLRLIRSPNCRCSGIPYVESVEGETEVSKASTFKDPVTGKDKG